jgi:hypothetical protein
MIYDDYLLHYLGTLGDLGTLDGDLVEDLDVSILLF